MNTLKIAILAIGIAVASACSADTTKVEQIPYKEVDLQPRTKYTCVTLVKNGKEVKQCKTVKIHKKHGGTKVPPK